MIKRIFLCILFIIMASVASGAVSIPITISEPVVSGVPGIARSNEPVSVGVPIPDSAGITTTTQLGLDGATCGQFRILKSYPSGNAWWVLVDTIASVIAGGNASVTLTTGGGNFGGSNLASTSGTTITISTGTATFTIDTALFNIINSAVVGTTTLVSSGNSGQIFIDVGGTIYSSANSTPTVALEENGPVRCVVKATGRLTDGSNNSIGGYTLRLHFFKGTSSVMIDAEVSNAYSDCGGLVNLSEATIQIPLSVISGLNYEFGYNGSSSSGTISTSAYMYQGDYDVQDRAPDTGLEIKNGATTINAIGTSTDYSNGWGIIDDGNKGVAVGIQQMYLNEPSGFEFTDGGVVNISLVSKHMSSSIAFQGGTHIMDVVWLDFFTSRPTTSWVEHFTQYPLFGRATSLSSYNDAGGVYGVDIVSVDDERAFFTANGETFPESNIANTIYAKSNTDYTWASSGTPNSDRNIKYLIDYLRTGNGGLFLSSLQGVIRSVTVAIYRSDGFNFYTDPVDFNRNSSYWGQPYDEEHTYWEGDPYLYLTTGREFIKDGIADFGEWLEHYTKETGYRSYYRISYSRNWSRSYRNFGILSWILESTHYQSISDDMTSLLYKTPDTDTTHQTGINFNRGYIHPANGIDSDFMTSKLFPQSFYIVSFCRGDGWAMKERLEDMLTGLGFFVYGEFYGSTGDNCGDYGYPYNYDIDTTYSGTYRSKQSEIVLCNAYKQSGNTGYILRAIRTTFGDIDCLWGDTVASEWGVHELVKTYNNQTVSVGYVDAVGSGQLNINTSHVTDNGDGTFTLSWTEPVDGVSGYQIKFSDKSIVENVDFDQATRTYTYSPSTYENFWAALNISNEPSPSSSGDMKSVTIDVPTVISDYNSRYGLTSSDSGYKTYSATNTYYFAVKYFVGEAVEHIGTTLGGNSQFKNIGAGNSIIRFK